MAVDDLAAPHREQLKEFSRLSLEKFNAVEERMAKNSEHEEQFSNNANALVNEIQGLVAAQVTIARFVAWRLSLRVFWTLSLTNRQHRIK